MISLLGVCARLSALSYFLLRQGLHQAVVDDPVKAAQIAHQIIDYDLPAGFSERYAASTLGMQTALITDEGEQYAIWLAQAPRIASLSRQAFLERPVARLYHDTLTWERVDAKVAEIRGENTPVDVYVGQGQNGTRYIAWIASFTGNSAYPALLIIVGPQDSWQDSLGDAFIASIN